MVRTSGGVQPAVCLKVRERCDVCGDVTSHMREPARGMLKCDLGFWVEIYFFKREINLLTLALLHIQK